MNQPHIKQERSERDATISVETESRCDTHGPSDEQNITAGLEVEQDTDYPTETENLENNTSYNTEPVEYHPLRPQSCRSQTHVTVHRNDIESTTIFEGQKELQGLNVDIYDQQTYERSVFDQVDRAIDTQNSTDQSLVSSARNSRSDKVNDLVGFVQGDEDTKRSEICDISERDEQVIQLTRNQRLQKGSIKAEIPDASVGSSNSQDLSRLPRVPKISKIKIEPQEPTTESRSQTHQTLSQSSRHIAVGIDSSIGDEGDPRDYQSEEGSDIDGSFWDGQEYQSDDNSDAASADYSRLRLKKRDIQDDGDFNYYKERIKIYSRERAEIRMKNILEDGTESKDIDEIHHIDGNFGVPKEMWNNLFEHQKIGVRWLWELHQLGSGGILGDEMGLGKTIQMVAFLTALKTSLIVDRYKRFEGLGPTVLVCPATVMHQWLLEFRKWWPPFRVALLHETGNFHGDRRQLVRVMHKACGVLIVSYPGVVIYQDILHAYDWHYAILDEGHKIRNPDAQVTMACKRFRTPHRIILSGSPVQNNLKELWSIFDFIFPGKLGTLPVFMEQFSVPITQGGYANASDFQVQIAYKCACVLRDTIKPFLLRRTKAEVNSKLKLPERSEQVLFCKLTEKQRKLYQAYLESPTIRDIKRGMCQIFVGLIELRKICNHPDLFDASDCQRQIRKSIEVNEKRLKEFFSEDETYGHFRKSGKMIVVDALLKIWKDQGDKVLLFTQSRQMLRLFKEYLDELKYKHLVMDGTTPIGSRQTIIKEFNEREDIFVFLLTTRVGGVGVNLIGANRIIIYDPDWNPSTDIQARERAWRIGQRRHVIIYRLLTAGTIEEKIYHRQVFKLYLTNRILRDPKQKRFFKTNDLHELFRLGDDEKSIETNALFDDYLQITAEKIKKKKERIKDKKSQRKLRKLTLKGMSKPFLSEEKIAELRRRARELSQMVANQYGPGISRGIEEKANKDNDDNEPVEASGRNLELVNDISARPSTSRTSALNCRQTETKSKTRNERRLEHLVKQDVYAPYQDEEKTKNKRRTKDQQDYILENLFKKSNIFGALKHDKIETDLTSDFKVVESEAEKVARDAIRALKESRRLCLGSGLGIPTWSGTGGTGPRLMPKSKGLQRHLVRSDKRTTPASEDSNNSLLSSIKRRQLSAPLVPTCDSEDEEQDRNYSGAAQLNQVDDMADKVRHFILYRSATSGEAQTDELLDFFNQTFSPEKTAIFKAILHKMCVFSRRANKGFWKLKDEFSDISW